MRATNAIAIVCLVLGVALLAGPTFGFVSISADRGVSIGTADDGSGYLGVEAVDTVVDDRNDAEDVVVVTNNADETLAIDADATIDGPGLEAASGFDRELGPGDTTAVAVTCEPGTGSGETDLEVTVESASGDGISIEGLERSFTIERDCPGRPGPDPPGEADPGTGFDSVSVDDVSGFVSPSEERQQFRFTLAENRDPHEEIEIDLRDPHGEGVDYTETFWDDDTLEIVDGAGEIWGDDGTIVYQVAPQDGHDDEIVVEAGGYATDGDGGPYEVSFTRSETGEVGTAPFEIDGTGAGSDPFVGVGADDVRSGDGRQTFSFTPTDGLEPWEDEVRIDLGDVDGLAYDWDVVLEEGPGNDGNVWRNEDELVYQVNDRGTGGEKIVVSIGVEATAPGPGEVSFTRTDTGETAVESFEIE
ncbi:hypothetical protein [Natronococcus occultus]|uniref:Uncharacterized protein n=1 Tax=Natronococcus occultus SP4 TaxID=694430 RepID=L0JZK1_9EURY|nr:hypothetical protein [Natronococcus occultus]AGB38186.1 hypothetical protein Natoc_2411 [Natronococcus occultus SP4]